MEKWVQARYLMFTGEVLLLEDYEVSNYGQVRNKKTGNILSVRHEKGGYCRVQPHINREQKYLYVHRLVLSSFTDNVDSSLDVNHKDENKENNCLNNLEWLTRTENINYGTRNKRISKPVLQYDKSGAFIREWPSQKEVEIKLSINQGNICACCNGRCKSAGGFVWRYKDLCETHL